MSNYQIIEKEITEYAQEYLNKSNEPLELLNQLKSISPQTIKNAQKPHLLSAALIYIYLKINKLNGHGGITVKALAEYFDIKPKAITKKVFDVEFDLGRKLVARADEFYEFVDEVNRYEVIDEYHNFLESSDSQDIQKGIKKCKALIKKDPDFFDTYALLHEYYAMNNEMSKSVEILNKGFVRAMKLIGADVRFPDKLDWGWMENRHIIRIIFTSALFQWTVGEKTHALELFQSLLRANINDNIGARYMIVAIAEGLKSLQEYQAQFTQTAFGMDAMEVEEWFEQKAKKHPELIGWWIEAVEEELD